MFSLRQMSHISSDLIGLAASPLLAVTSPGWYNTIKHNLREQPQHYKLFRKILENVSQPSPCSFRVAKFDRNGDSFNLVITAPRCASPILGFGQGMWNDETQRRGREV